MLKGRERDKPLPRFGSMRRKMAKVVEGCWYSLLNVVPGSCSRYSDSVFALFDMVREVLKPSGATSARVACEVLLSHTLSQHRLSANGWDRPPDGAERISHLAKGARCIEFCVVE